MAESPESPTNITPNLPTYNELNQRLYVTKRRLREISVQANVLENTIKTVRREIAQSRHLSSSISYQLGKLLIESTRSTKGLLRLPAGLLQLVRLARHRRAIRAAKVLLGTHGYRVTQIPQMHPASKEAVLSYSTKPAKPYRKIFDNLINIASGIPDSNGSQYYKPLGLNVAIVTDEFMLNYYRSIFKNLVYVTPENYITAFRDHDIQMFIFVSCWSGLANDEWKGISYREKPKNALNAILSLSKSKNIPTVFQTIEDPSNYEHFLGIAKLFDHIFTTDIDCIPRYQMDTTAKTVSFGEFGANPLFNNPIGIKRKIHPGAFFAGSYPSRYPERCNDMHLVFDSLIDSNVDLIIADRNSDKSSSSLAFPEKYGNHIVSKVEHRLLQKIHKIFKYNINFNSIKNSPTMCAMRIYELQAQGSLLMSNYAKSVVNNFPAVDIINSRVDTSIYFSDTNSFEDYEKQVACIRNIMTDKTGFDKTRLMLSTIGLNVDSRPIPAVLVIARDVTPRLREMFELQIYPNKRFVNTDEIDRFDLSGHAYYAFFSSEYDYEENYLVDMINGFKYTNSRYVTKAAFFEGSEFRDGPQHEFIDRVPSIFRTVFDATQFTMAELLGMQPDNPCERGYCIDPFELNYSQFMAARQTRCSQFALSVIIPVYNNGEFLRYKCFESLRRNKLFDQMELIIVDDGSTDQATIATLSLLKRRYANVTIFSYTDGGSGSASRPRNKGMELASAPLITFLDPDNEISPQGYDRLHALFTKSEQEGRPLDLIAGYQIKVGSEQKITAKHTNDQMTVFEDPRNSFLLKRRFPIISTQAALIRKSFLLEKRIDFVQKAVGQDTLYSHELLAHARRVAFTSAAHLVYYAERSDSVTNSIDIRFFQKSLILEQAQHQRLSIVGLLDDYVEVKFRSFFEDWYLEKLKLADETVRPAALSILKEILVIYGLDPTSFNEKGIY